MTQNKIIFVTLSSTLRKFRLRFLDILPAIKPNLKNLTMKIEISTTSKSAEAVNAILEKVIRDMKKNPKLKTSFKLSETALNNASSFQKSLAKKVGTKPVMKTKLKVMSEGSTDGNGTGKGPKG